MSAGTHAGSDVVSRAADCVAWAWTVLDEALVDGLTDPVACSPFIQPDTTTFYWELHFRDGHLQGIDFLHRPALVSTESAGEAPLADPILQRLSSWYATSDAAREHCHPSVWLELDGPLTAERGAREQGVSVCVDRTFGGRGGAEAPVLTADALTELFAGLEGACGAGRSRAPDVAKTQQAVAAAGGRMRHVSIMRGRTGRPVKIYAALPKSRFSTFLEAIDWPGDRAEASGLAAAACAESRRVNVDLLIDDGLSERIGFEVFSDPSPAEDVERGAALERALAQGLVSERVVEGLRRWIGTTRRPFGNDQWPTTVQRWFDLKFVNLGAGALELKAYLGFRMCRGIFA
jgi:hypothetical protein